LLCVKDKTLSFQTIPPLLAVGEASARVSGGMLKVIKTHFAEKRKINLIFNTVCRWFQFINLLYHKQYSLVVITGPSDLNLFDALKETYPAIPEE